MESLSRPFHSRKLSNAATFSNKNPYDGVLSGHRRKFAGPSATNIQDYREIFGSSQPSSIPLLDLSTLREPSDDLSSNFRSSNPDYSKIFGGFLDEEDVAVSYEELFGCDKVRATRQSSQDSDGLCHLSPDGLKQFSMSYNKINQKSKDGLDGTKHVTQLPAVTGFTRFIDEPVMEAEKQNPQKQPSRNAVESVFDDKKSKTFDVDFKTHPSTVSSSPTGVVNRKSNPRRSVNSESCNPRISVNSESCNPRRSVNSESCNPRRSVNSESCRREFDEGIDVKSAAYDSSAALKKAIEKAQESIRIAKESVGRKEKGLRSFSNKKFKNRSKVEGSMEGVKECGDEKCRDEDSSQTFQDVGRNHEYGEKLLVAKKFIDDIHEKISESNKDSKYGDNMVVYSAAKVTSETESKPLDSDGKDKYATLSSEAVETETIKIQISDFVHEDQADNMCVDEHEAEINVSKPTIDILEDQSVAEELESDENNDEVRLSHAHELVKELSNLNVSQNDNEGVLEHEESENAESEKHEEIEEAFEQVKSENESKHEQNTRIQKEEEAGEMFERNAKDSENAESEKYEEIEEAFEQVKSENESKHEQNSEIQKEEETGEMFERNVKDSVQSCDHKLEETEVNLHDNSEIKHEDDPTVESDEDFDEKSSSDNNVMEETNDISCMHVESKIVEMNDIHMETTQEVDEVTEISCELQAEEADYCDRTCTDQTASDDDEDEYDQSDIIDNLADLGSENDVQSESSSGSTYGVKIIEEEGNIQPSSKEIPDNESINEIKESQEPESRHKEDETEEAGPSQVSGKERFRTVEEVAAKEREWEKNKLAVERAIREARERAFAEARERAERERAAVEKATQEVRQRMMAEAHEKVSKASVTNTSSSEKTSAQSKLRAERAAVERATSEARQRALEKAISQKTVSDLNHSESALRTKAKLEKHNRIMERAAKALAEKEKRDRLAQKEQAERNRLAENLDAEIKRWSNGKEKNLRALLSTLQYILGPESGWQPVSLTEMITTSAVKKAYRKATLCVHPDKLQQRGATVQHKYICEKVFDLLKAAWNRFNSEER